MAGYSGANVLMNLELDYEYVGHNSSNELDNLMQISLNHINGDDLTKKATDFEAIGRRMVNMAQRFLVENGNIRTKNLLRSITFNVEGSSLILMAPAVDYRGHPYAGHIEFGFTGLDGKPYGPWPFLRPAVRMAAAESRGELEDSLAEVLSEELNPYGRIGFGRASDVHNTVLNSSVKNARRQFGASNNKQKGWSTATHGNNHPSRANQFYQTNSHNSWKTGGLVPDSRN